MSVVTRGRVIRGAPQAVVVRGPADPRPEAPKRALESRGSRRPKGEVEGHLIGQRIIEVAREKAAAIVAKAAEEATAAVAAAVAEAREAEQAKLAALYLALRADEERRAERDLDRTISLAIVLAERLLGQALDQNPVHVTALARQALAEARGARRVTIEAHPLDAAVLQSHLEVVATGEASVEVRVNGELGRGSLRVHTNLGTLDAELTPQLERLAKALREALDS